MLRFKQKEKKPHAQVFHLVLSHAITYNLENMANRIPEYVSHTDIINTFGKYRLNASLTLMQH